MEFPTVEKHTPYTILSEQSAGIVPRALSQIFSEYQNGIAQCPCFRVHNDQIEPLNDDEVESI
jgi:hypothetical protein